MKGRILVFGQLVRGSSWLRLSPSPMSIKPRIRRPLMNRSLPPSDVNPAENPAASDESKPASVDDSDLRCGGERKPDSPWLRKRRVRRPETGVGTTMQPEPIAPAEEPVAPAAEPIAPAAETVVADQAVIPPEPSSKTLAN